LNPKPHLNRVDVQEQVNRAAGADYFPAARIHIMLIRFNYLEVTVPMRDTI